MNPTESLQSCVRCGGTLVRPLLLIVIAAVFLTHAAFFTVSEGQAVVVTRFGRPVREIIAPGAYWKFPTPVDQLRIIDRRRQLHSTPQVATLTRDKKNVVLTTFVVWHVAEPLKFLQTVGTVEAAQLNLTSMIAAAKNQQLGRVDLTALVSLDRSQIQLDSIEGAMQQAVSQAAIDKLGISVDQIGFERIALPQENMSAVLERMRAERVAEANRIRTEGSKQARAIRDEAHVKSQEILRRGREESGRIFAEAERQAGELLATAHQQNPAFYEFWSALQAAKQSLKERSTLILRSNQLFFESLLKAPDEAARDVARGQSTTSPGPSFPNRELGAP